MLYALLFVIVTLSIYITYVLITHYKYLSRTDYAISQKYNSYENFRNTIKVLVKFYLKKLNRVYKFLTHYLALLFIKFINIMQSLFGSWYKKLINSFLEASIENKSYVKFFWKDLKKFKKEIDSDSNL